MPHEYSRRSAMKRFAQMAGGVASVATLSPSLFLTIPSFARARESKTLYLATWAEYIDKGTINDFQKLFGATVHVSYFDDSSVLFAKMRGGTAYDVVVPADNWVARFIEAGLFMSLDHKKIPNMRYLFSRFNDAVFDKGRKYTLPYMWGTLGIGYRKSSMHNGIPNSWHYLYDSDVYAGKIAFLTECDPTIACGLICKGEDPNSTDIKKNTEIATMLIRQKRNIVQFAPGTEADLLLSREAAVTMAYNGDMAHAINQDSDLGYLVPKEGGVVWQDVIAIPKNAPSPNLAHSFINYIYTPAVNAHLATSIMYSTPNEAAYKLLPKSVQNNDVVYPTKKELDRCYYLRYLGEKFETLRENLCIQVRAT